MTTEFVAKVVAVIRDHQDAVKAAVLNGHPSDYVEYRSALRLIRDLDLIAQKVSRLDPEEDYDHLT